MGQTDVVLAVEALLTDPVLASGALEKDRTVKLWSAEETKSSTAPSLTDSQNSS